MEKYNIIKEIGEGNYGKAVLVRNMEDKNLYVIKVIISNLLNKFIFIIEYRYLEL